MHVGVCLYKLVDMFDLLASHKDQGGKGGLMAGGMHGVGMGVRGVSKVLITYRPT